MEMKGCLEGIIHLNSRSGGSGTPTLSDPSTVLPLSSKDLALNLSSEMSGVIPDTLLFSPSLSFPPHLLRRVTYPAPSSQDDCNNLDKKLTDVMSIT